MRPTPAQFSVLNGKQTRQQVVPAQRDEPRELEKCNPLKEHRRGVHRSPTVAGVSGKIPGGAKS